MKKNDTLKKIFMNKITVANLEKIVLETVKGGNQGTTHLPTCPPCDSAGTGNL